MDVSNLNVIVGEGTCGIAAGSKEVIEAFQKHAPEINIRTVGCVGMCHQEVIAEINDGNGNKHIYGNVTKNTVPQIIKFHKGEGELPDKQLIFSPDNQDQDKWSYLAHQTRIALRNVGYLDPTSIGEYQARDGYKAIKKIIAEMTPEQVIEEVKISSIRGRGGAGFPTHVKWNFAKQSPGDIKYLICNGDEGDPGAFMDRSLLEGDPHNVIEGMLIAAYSFGASKGYAYIRAEYPLAVENFGKAIKDAHEIGVLGDNIQESNFSFDIKIKEGAGAFVCGEETALIASIEGDRGMPRFKPPFPAIKGLFGKPTIINNVETLANLSWIINNGGKAYAAHGTEDSKGTKVFALAGAIKKGGLVEVPMGTKIRYVLEDIGGGSSSDLPLKAVQLGGPSGGSVPENLFDTTIEYAAINATGAIMGSGGMIVMDGTTCMVDLAKYFLGFTQNESCGKCTFCRIGTLRMRELLTKICDGKGEMEDLTALEELTEQIKKSSLCGLGQTAPNPVATTLKYFRNEYEAHIKDKKCPAAVCKSLITHTITASDCSGCSLCEMQCPVDAITGKKKIKGSYVIDQAKCINCGMCFEVCNSKAIIVK
jgi:NADH-quinone oxidoreductase subunit F